MPLIEVVSALIINPSIHSTINARGGEFSLRTSSICTLISAIPKCGIYPNPYLSLSIKQSVPPL